MKAIFFTLVVALVSLLNAGIVKAEDVYVVGGKNISNTWVAGSWKNGVFTQLGTGTTSSYAVSVFISGEDLYVGGYENDAANKTVAKLWKNGGLVGAYGTLGQSSSVRSIYVDGNDVYLAGYDKPEGTTPWRSSVLWKNGTLMTLSTLAAESYSIFASGGYIYVAGYEIGTGGKRDAKYWKINVETQAKTEVILAGSSSTIDYTATSIFVVGEDVYVAGYERNATVNIPKFWKNGEPTNLSAGSSLANTIFTASSIFVNGTDVHVVGWENTTSIGRHWLNNGTTTVADLTGTNYTKSMANSVDVYNGSIYAAGEVAINGGLAVAAVYWKDGVATLLEESNPATAKAIKVVTSKSTDLGSDKLENGITLFYDASTDNIVVEGIQDISTLALYDMNGKQLFSKVILSNVVIPSYMLTSGVYLAKIENNGNLIRYKFIK